MTEQDKAPTSKNNPSHPWGKIRLLAFLQLCLEAVDFAAENAALPPAASTGAGLLRVLSAFLPCLPDRDRRTGVDRTYSAE